MKINIREFKEKYFAEYKFLYNSPRGGWDVAGYDEAVEAFDAFCNRFPEFVSEFCTYIGDFITSDREAAAFMFAIESMGALV